MEQILDRIACGIIQIAVEGEKLSLLEVNSAFSRMLVVQPQDLAGQNLDKLPQELGQSEFWRSLLTYSDRCRVQKQPVTYTEFLARDATICKIAVTLSPLLDTDGCVHQIVGICQALDNIINKQDSKDLDSRTQAEQFAHLIKETSDAAIVVDREGRVQYANRAAEVIFNRSVSELVGEMFGLPVVSGELTDVDIIRKGGEPAAAEMRVVETKGEGEIAYIVASLRDITERKQAEESLKLRERAIAASSNGIIITDARQKDNPIIYANPGFERITGYSAAEAIGQNCRFLQGKEPNQLGLTELRNCIREQRECHVVLSNYRKDGTQFWNDLYVSPVFNEYGELTNYVGIQNDITERVKTELELYESAARLSTILTTVKEGITFSNEWGHFEVFNPEMENITGYTMQEANACGDFTALLYPDPHEQYLALERLALFDRPGATSEVETTICTKSGDRKNVLVSTSVVSYKGQKMFLSAYHDITERKRNEEKLRHQREREHLLNAITLEIRRELNLEKILTTTVAEVRQLLHSDRVVIYQFRPDWGGAVVVESVLSSADSILGASISDPVFSQEYIENYRQGRTNTIDDALTAEIGNCYRQMLEQFKIRANLVVPIVFSGKLWGLLVAHQCREPRSWQQFEVELLKQIANHVAIAIQQAELYQEKQVLNTELQVLNADLERQVAERTAQLEMQQLELRQSLEKEKELGELKSRFVSIASHEFRTPLATIQAASDLLKHYSHKMTEQKRLERLDKIQAEVRNMTSLLEEVLIIGKAEAGKLEIHPTSVDLKEFCCGIIDDAYHSLGTKHQIDFSSEGDCYNAVVDAKLLRQIIDNLISNAIKYSPQGGDVGFRLICRPEQITIKISDRGIGIPQEDVNQIFDSFYRSGNVGNISGTGLGLTIAKASVELHGGSLTVESEVNVGTTFTVAIPNNPNVQIP
jgi:PAS domain S-box-containing protein